MLLQTVNAQHPWTKKAATKMAPSATDDESSCAGAWDGGVAAT